MRVGIIAFLALCVVAAIADESNVVVLDNTNFDKFIAENDISLIEFYAPWCGHCKRLEPEYEKAATELLGKVPLAKVNAAEENNRPIASTYRIGGFPTLKVFRKGAEPTDFEGERSAASIVSFMKKQLLPSVSTLASSEEVNTFADQDKVVIVGFFANKDSAAHESFKKTADKLRNKYLFGAVVGDSKINTEFGVSNDGVVLFKKFDEKKNVLEASKIDTLEEFITISSVPLIDEIGPNNYRLYMESKIPLAYLFVDLTVAGQQEANVEKVYNLAKEHKGKLNWVYIDSAKYGRHGERLGLSGKTVPALAIEKTDGSGTHYAFDEKADFSVENIVAWVNKFLSNELEPTIRSEEIPESNDGPVKIVVNKQFDEIVKDTTKDVFVEFYAPWCGHCKKLAPVFDELGALFKGTDVVIAKMDATANDIDPKLGVSGFPTLKLFVANKKDTPVDYEGDRSLEDMIQFIKNNAATKVENVVAPAKDEL